MKIITPMLSPKGLLRSVAGLGIAMVLSACTADQYAAESNYQPLGGSDRYPIKVVNGKAVTKPCGDWSEDAGNTLSNQPMKNHGCAVQQNIAAMVAEPEDIVNPDKMGPVDSSLRTPMFVNVNLNGGSTSSTPAKP